MYAIDLINKDATLLPTIKLGAILLDSCSSNTHALNQSLEFVRAWSPTLDPMREHTLEESYFFCDDGSQPKPKDDLHHLVGVVGGSYSEVSLQVANLLRLFDIPQVSSLLSAAIACCLHVIV